MQSADQSREWEVRDPLQAAAFANPLRCRLLLACTPGERSLSDLRGELGQPLAKLHYHLGRLLDARLLTVSRIEPRAGRPIRFYRAIAERFLVPQEALAELPGERWAAELRELLQRSRGPVLLRYAYADKGRMTVNLVQAEDDLLPRDFERWHMLSLSPRQRMALAKDLAEVLERHAKMENEPGAEPYLAHAAFAPRPTG